MLDIFSPNLFYAVLVKHKQETSNFTYLHKHVPIPQKPSQSKVRSRNTNDALLYYLLSAYCHVNLLKISGEGTDLGESWLMAGGGPCSFRAIIADCLCTSASSDGMYVMLKMKPLKY